jgi:ribonuclease BN (tRNA processing enzyme)
LTEAAEPVLSLTVLGADGSFPGPGGACSGYLIECGDAVVWLDAGSGSLANLQRHVALSQIDAVVLSHGHPDHWSDIEGFYVACRYFYGLSGIPVYAPRGLAALTTGVGDDGVLVWHDIVEGPETAIGPIHLAFSRTDHPVETYAVRIEAGGRRAGYSADTGPGWALRTLGPLDLALVEASFLSDKEGIVQHLSARQAGVMARQANAERLVITHIGPTIDRQAARAEAEAAFGAPVEVATIDDRFVI